MRLFVAVDLPADVRSELARWARDAVGADDRLRLVRAESLHATLVFLGERPDGEAPGLAGALAAALGDAARAPELRLDGALWLSPRRPHVLTAGLSDPSGGLARIHEALREGLSHDAERRPLRPHVTVARVRGRIRPFEVAAPPAIAFHPPAVTLYRSRLGGGPATYEPLSSVPLSTLP